MPQLSDQALQYFDYRLRNVPTYDNKLKSWREKKRYLDMELDKIGVTDETERSDIARQYLGNEPLYDGSFFTERLPEALSQGVDKAGMNIGGMIEYAGQYAVNPNYSTFGREMAAENRKQIAEAPQFIESPEALDKKGFLRNIDDYALAATSDIIGSSPVMAAPIVGGMVGGVPGAAIGVAGALGGGALLEGGSTFSDYRASLIDEGVPEPEANKLAKFAADEVTWKNLTDAELLPYALAQGLSGPILGGLSKLGKLGKLGKFGKRLENLTPRKQALIAGGTQIGTGGLQERRQYEVTESATGNPMDRFEGFTTPEGRFATTVGAFAEGPMTFLEAATAKDRDSRIDPVKTDLVKQATEAAQAEASQANQVAELQAKQEEDERIAEQLRKRQEAEEKAYNQRIKDSLDLQEREDRAAMTRRRLLVQEAKARSELRNIEEAEANRGKATTAKRQQKNQEDLNALQKEIKELEELRSATEGSTDKKAKAIQTSLQRSIDRRQKEVAKLERGIADEKGRADIRLSAGEAKIRVKELRDIYEKIGSSTAEANNLRQQILAQQAKGEDVSENLTRFQEVSKNIDTFVRQAENLQSQLDPTGDVAAAPSDATATQKRQLREETTNEALAGILGRTPQTPAEQVAEQLSPAPQDIPEFEGVTPATEEEMQQGAGLDVASGVADRLITTGRELEELAPREPRIVDPIAEVSSREIKPKESSVFFDPSLEVEDQAPYFTSASQEVFNRDFVEEVEQEKREQDAQNRISRKRVDRLPDDIDQLMDVARPPQEPPARETLPEELTQKAFGELRSPVAEAEAEADAYVQKKRDEIRKRVADEIKARADLGDKKPRGMKMGSTMKLLNPVKIMQEIVNGDMVETQLSFEQLRLLDQALTSERRKGVIDDAIKQVLDKNPDLRASTPKAPTQEAPKTTPEAPTTPAEVAGQTADPVEDVIAKYEKMAKEQKAAKQKKAEPKQKRGRTIADKNAKKIQPDVTREAIEQQTAQFLEDGGEVTKVEEVKKEPTKTQQALEEFNRKVEERENVQPEPEAPKATGRLRRKGEQRTEDQGVVQEEPAAETQATAEETLKKYRETVKRELGKPMDLTTDEIREMIDDQDIGGMTDALLNYNFREELGKSKQEKDQEIENRIREELESLGVDPDQTIKDFENSLNQQTLSFSKKTVGENAKPAFGNLSKIQAQAALRGMQTIVQRLNEKSFLSEEGGYIRVAENLSDAVRMLREMGEGAAALQLAREVRNNPNDIFEAFITKKDGQVILVADQMQGADLNGAVERMVEVVFHEVIGHKGLRALMGEDYNTFIDQYGRKYKKDIQNWLKTDGKAYQGEPSFFKQTEEYIAINFAEKGAQKIGFGENLIQSIAGALGLAKYSNTALKRAMLMIEQDLAGSGGSILDGVNIGFVADAQSLEEDEKQDGTYQPRELNYSRREYQDALNKTGLIHNNLIAAKLGKYPDYLNPVVNAMQQMQQNFNSGNLRVRDVAKGYFITISSMGKKEQPRTTIEAQLRRQIPGFKELPPQFVENYNGKEVVRPEENAAWALTTDLGQRLLNDLENGQYDAKGWVDLASNYFSKTYGRNDLLKPGYLQGKGGGYSLERVQELTDAVNAKPGDTDNLYAQMNKFQGIGEGKTGFIASMFGVGGMLTLDAVELNAWITGQGDITPLTRAVDSEMGINQQPSILGIKQDYEQKFAEAENNPDLSEEDKGKLFKQLRRGKTTELNSERMRLRIEFLDGKVEPVGGRPAQLTPEQRERLRLRYLFKDANADDQAQLRDIVAQRFGEIRDDGTLEPSQGMQQIPVDLFDHIVHHWAWDSYKGARTKHEGIYDAMLNYSRRVDEVDSKMVHGELYSDSTLSFSKRRLLESGVPEKLADELAGKKMGILTADRTKWGKYKGMNPGSKIDLFMYGGPAYGENNKGKGAAWASAEDAAKKFFNPVSELADRGLFGIVLLKPENHLGSYGVFQAFVAELKEGKQFGSYDWDMTTRIFEKMKDQTRLLKEFPGAADAKDIVELYEGILENVGHRERGKYITRMIEAKGDRSTKRDGFASAGLKDLAMYVMQETADSRFLNTPMGTMIGIGQVDPKGKVSSASDFGVQEHPSYNAVIPGTFLTMLKNPVPLWDHAFDWIINQDKQPNPFFRTKKDEQGQSIKEFEQFTRVAQKKSSGGKPLFDASGNPVMSSQNRTEAAQESGVTMYYMTAPDQSVQEIAQDVLTQIPDDAPNLSYSRRTKPDPKKTVKAYKLFRVKKTKKGELFPLFVRANEPAEVGVWLDADIGEMAESGKVQSSLGELAFRPGWHAGDAPFSHHIGSGKPPTYRPENQVWAEVEMAADVDWQTEANKRAKRYKSDSKATGMKKGDIIPKTAEIKDGIPEDGYYRYKTNPNMVGEWLIGGSIKINRILTDEETLRINQEKGILDKQGNLAVDLPRKQPLDLAAYGFDEDSLSFSKRQGINASIDAIEAQASRAVDMLWQKSVILDKAYQKTMDLLEPMSSVPRLKEYLAARRRLRGVIDRNEEIATKVYDAFKDTKNPKQIYEFMTTKGADPKMIINRMERMTAERAKKAIEQIGDRMVEAGLTEQATIDAMKGQYLPRVYLKYLLKDEDANMMFKNNRRPSDLGYLKNRKDIPEGIRKLILGEIEDPAYLASRAIMQPGRDLALLDWMSWISTQPDWTLQQSLVNFDLQDRMRQIAKRVGGDNLVQQMGITADRAKQRENIANEIKELREEIKQIKKENQAVPVKGQAKLLSAKNAELKTLIKERGKLPSNYKATPYYLMAEAERIEAQILNNDNEIVSGQERQVLMEVVNEMRNAARGQIADIDTMGLSPKEWRQIPDTKRYGKLRGMTVRAEIYDDIIGSYNMSPDSSEGFAGKLLGDGGYLAQANSIWKWSKVAANPPSYIRNFTSNVILMNLGGVRIQRVPGLIGKAFEAYRGKGKYYQLAKKHGLLSSGFSGNEIQMLENEYVAAQRRAAKDGGLSGYAAMRIAADIFTKIQNLTGDAYGFIDGFGKIMMMTDAMENQGMNEADAAAYAEKWLFDYSHVGANVRFLRNHALGSPFITFTAKVAPRLLETMRYKPWRFAPWIGLSYALAEAVKSAFDWDDEDVEAAFLALPDYLREKGQTAVVPLPFKDAEGRIQFLDISYLLPWGLFQEIGNELSRGDIGAAFMSTGLLGGPVMNIATAIQSNKDSFTQREIIDRTKDPASQIADLFLYAYNMSAPPFLNTEYGGIRRMQQALTGELDQMGQPTYTVGQAAGRLSGFNTTPLDLRQSRSDNIRRFEREISNLRRDKTRDVRRAYRMKKDRTEINKIISDYNDLIKEKRDALIEYRKKSRLPIGA